MKEKWLLRLWNWEVGKQDEEILPWTEVILREDPAIYEDPDDDPRSVNVIIASSSRYDMPDWKAFYNWIDSSFGNARRKPKHCFGHLMKGTDERFMNYVYAEEYYHRPQDPHFPDYREHELKLDYRTVSRVLPLTIIEET